MAGVSLFGAGFFVFSCAFGQNDKRILSERRKGQRDAQREPNPVRVFTGRSPSWLELKLVEQRLLKNNGGCWPSTKCQSRLWEYIRDSYRESNLSPGAGACFAADDTSGSTRPCGWLQADRQAAKSTATLSGRYFSTICTVYMPVSVCFF